MRLNSLHTMNADTLDRAVQFILSEAEQGRKPTTYQAYCYDAQLAGVPVLMQNWWEQATDKIDWKKVEEARLERVLAPYRAKIRASYRRRFPGWRANPGAGRA